MSRLNQQSIDRSDLQFSVAPYTLTGLELSLNRDSSLSDLERDAVLQANVGDNPAFDLIGLTQLRNDPDYEGIDGSGFSVAVIDSGIDTEHPLLADNYVTGVDFVDGDSDPNDVVGHGTHVAGTVGARDETIGVATDAGLIGLKVAEGERVDYNAVVDSLEWVLDNHEEYNIVAVNMSLGGGFYTSEAEVIGDRRFQLVRQLEEEGIVIVSSAGNLYDYKDAARTEPNQEQNLGAPAIYSTIAVGAVWQDNNPPSYYPSSNQEPGADRIAFFSQRLNSDNFLFAPGAYINSTYIDDDGFELLLGTSMASPHVAGSVALLQEAALQFGGRLLTPEEIVEILRGTSDTVFDGDDEADLVTNTNINYGRINIYNAVVEVRRRFENIAPIPDDSPPDGGNPPISNDPNGTIAGAFIAPSIDGSESPIINGTIGFDGNGNFIGSKDVDIFRFTVESPGNVNIKLGSHTSEPEDFDTYLRLFDGLGNELAANDDIARLTNNFSEIETFLEPGTYYAGVSGYQNNNYNPNVAGSGIVSTTGNYSIEFSLNNVDPNGLISGAQEVNLGNDLEPLIFPGFIGGDYGEPVGVADVDLFRIAVPDNGILLIDIDTPYDEEYVDSFLRLFDARGNELVFANTGDAFVSDNHLSIDANDEDSEYLDPDFPGLVFDSETERTLINGGFDSDGNYVKGSYGHESDSFLGIMVNRGDVYHIGVSNSADRDYDPTNLDNRLETGEGGFYELIVTFANNDLNGTITQLRSQTAISPVFTSTENIGLDEERDVGDRDVDFWKINSSEAGILEIDIDGSSDDFVDTVALLFDADGNTLATNDDTEGLDPLLRYQINPDTDYYIGVTGYGNENFDPFGLGTGSGGDTGEYTINSNLLPLSEFNNLANNSIENGSIDEIEIGEIIRANIGEDNGLVVGAEDVDLYRLIVPRDDIVNIRVNANGEFSANTFLRLFDSEGNEIAFNDDENNLNRGSFLEQELTADTEYYIGVNGSSDRAREYDPLTGDNAAVGSRGDYTLSVSYQGDIDPLDTAIYRFQNTDRLGTYIYVGESERQNIRQNLAGFVEEGLAFKVATQPGDNLIPIYRFQNNIIPGTYLYTGEAERNNINTNFSETFTEEGLAFYVYGANEGQGSTLYRFQNTAQPGTYIFVAEEERENIIENFPSFVEEGIAFEVGIF